MRPLYRLVFLATLLLLAGPLIQGCAGCSRGSSASDDDDDDDDGVTGPVITQVIPAEAKQSSAITVQGERFGDVVGSSTLTVGGIAVTPDTWSDSTVTFTVGASIPPGDAPVVITVGGLASNEGPFRVVLASAAYTHNDDGPMTISAFAIDSAGKLTELPGSPHLAGGGTAGFGGDNSGLAVHPGRRLLFATTNTAVAVFAIDGVTGALTPVSGSPFPTGTAQNYGVAVSPDGSHVYVAGYAGSSVAVLSIGANGSLTPITGSPFAGRIDGFPDGMVMHPSGSWLLVNQEGLQGIDVWSVSGDGSIALVGTNSHVAMATTVYALEMDPTGGRVYTGGAAGAVAGYAFDVLDGSLTPLPSSPYSTTGAAGSPAISPDGARFYSGDGSNGDIYGFSVGVDGSLTGLSGFPTNAGGSSPQMLDIGRDGRWLVTADEGSSRINVFEIETDGGILLVSSAALPVSGDPSDVLVTP